jgi:hypothetical protein
MVGELGLDYVGVDVDGGALAEVAKRGLETRQIDLGAGRGELREQLSTLVAGRSIAAVLAVDLLEHLVEPAELLAAVRSLATEGAAWPLIVSVPNVTHTDIAAKLLLGRWDLTEFGLLDDTHLRFFSWPLFERLFATSGWVPDGSADTVTGISEQAFPVDAPVVRHGTPARELLADLSSRAHVHSNTFQFVRRFRPGRDAAAEFSWAIDPDDERPRCFASVLVDATRQELDIDRILADLDAQTARDFEVIVLTSSEDPLSLEGRTDMRTLEVAEAAQAWNRGIEAAKGRYVCFIDGSARVARGWIESFQAAGDRAGHVLCAGAAAIRPSGLAAASGEDLIASGRRLQASSLDLLSYGRPGPAVLSACAVPRQAAQSAGLRFESEHGPAAAAVFLHRAALLCAVSPLETTTVAVAEGSLGDPELELDAVVASLNSAPLLLPVGAAARVADLRRGILEAHKSLGWRLTKPLRLSRWRRRRREAAT